MAFEKFDYLHFLAHNMRQTKEENSKKGLVIKIEVGGVARYCQPAAPLAKAEIPY